MTPRVPFWCAASAWYATSWPTWARPLQNAFQPAGPQAEHIERLWQLLLGVCTAVFVAVLVAFLCALLRAPRADAATAPDLTSLARPHRRAQRAVVAAVAVSAALLLGLIGASVFTDRVLAQLPTERAVQITVTSHQWWWDARYGGADASEMFTTANELHIPVGRPVVLTLQSSDVIHSFWVPSLTGKKDLIPGRTATLRLQADRPGVYRGQCAEFCGTQHARMALLIVAEPEEAFERWAAQQRAPAREPSDEQQRRGRDVFERASCAMCHAIQGTRAGGRHAPDLTHLASRRTIAAGTLANNVGNLAGWIVDPHRIKPGVNMPANALSPDDLHALLAYLGSLE